MNNFTSFLFAKPSFMEGVSRVLDLGGTLNQYNRSRTAEEADSLAMWADWSAVGSDLLAALKAKSSTRGVK